MALSGLASDLSRSLVQLSYRALCNHSPRTTICGAAQGNPNRGMLASRTPAALSALALKRRSIVGLSWIRLTAPYQLKPSRRSKCQYSSASSSLRQSKLSRSWAAIRRQP